MFLCRRNNDLVYIRFQKFDLSLCGTACTNWSFAISFKRYCAMTLKSLTNREILKGILHKPQ